MNSEFENEYYVPKTYAETAMEVIKSDWEDRKSKDCKKYTVPKSNTDFWVEKVARNQQRDQDVWRQLEAKDWSVIIVWECELEKKRFDETIDRVRKEIIENGRQHEQRRQERKLLREQRLMERREQKARQAALLSEIRNG